MCFSKSQTNRCIAIKFKKIIHVSPKVALYVNMKLKEWDSIEFKQETTFSPLNYRYSFLTLDTSLGKSCSSQVTDFLFQEQSNCNN